MWPRASLFKETLTQQQQQQQRVADIRQMETVYRRRVRSRFQRKPEPVKKAIQWAPHKGPSSLPRRIFVYILKDRLKYCGEESTV